MTTQGGKQIIPIHMLPIISGSKDNQTKKFDQLIEILRSIFLQKLYIKYGGKTNPRPFYKKSKFGVS